MIKFYFRRIFDTEEALVRHDSIFSADDVGAVQSHAAAADGAQRTDTVRRALTGSYYGGSCFEFLKNALM